MEQGDRKDHMFYKLLFSERYTTNWSYDIDKNTETKFAVIPSYQCEKVFEGCNEALLKNTTVPDFKKNAWKSSFISNKRQNNNKDHK